jgi:hypothetical protein
MHGTDAHSEQLGWTEIALWAMNPDLPHLRIYAWSHYGPPDRIAFVSVYGTGGDRTRRQQIRTGVNDMLRRLRYAVELEPGRDIHDVTPRRPTSAHDELRMLRCRRAACGTAGEGR